MRFLTEAESRRVAGGIGPAVPPGEEHDGWPQVWMDTRGCEGRSAATARLFADLVGPGQDVLLWVTESGTWPSSENWPLFESLRGAHGETRPLRDAPGHLVGAAEPDGLVSFLQLAVVFGWGGLVAGTATRRRLFLSHDSWALLSTPDGEATLREKVEAFGLPCRAGG